MKKKTSSKPMVQILDRLRAYGEFVVIIFDQEDILNSPVENWPCCDCLICFFSSGFPIQKAADYVRLRRPFCINDVPSQVVLNDRFQVYQILQDHQIPTAKFIIVDRKKDHDVEVCEFDDYVTINGVRLNKPLVEKPQDADNHNVIVYYKMSEKGGSRRLFRKVGNRSSRYFPKCNKLRRKGSFVYEEFIEGGQDLKVYTLCGEYGHAESRKSPEVDGIVQRDPDGKELRLTTRLTNFEKKIGAEGRGGISAEHLWV